MTQKTTHFHLQIISGGQTGVDRAALDVALDHGIPCGGSCPQGRKAEYGPIPQHYPLTELASPDYRVRTRKNILDSHGTLIVHHGHPRGGTLLTQNICLKQKRPHLLIDAQEETCQEALIELLSFIQDHFITILNVAGPRKTSWEHGYHYTHELLSSLLKKNVDHKVQAL